MDFKKKYWLIGMFILVVLVGAVVISKKTKPASVEQGSSGVVSPDQTLPSAGSERLNGSKVKGPDGAPIIIQEFSDFQCPSCKKAREPLEALIKEFPNLIQVQYFYFPLPMHRYAMDAAKFAECAGAQGKFWPMSDLLFNEQEVWANDPDAVALFVAYVNSLGLDRPNFQSCLNSAATMQAISNDRERGQMMQISSTPTFFINGERVVGAKQLADTGAQIVQKKLESLVKR